MALLFASLFLPKPPDGAPAKPTVGSALQPQRYLTRSEKLANIRIENVLWSKGGFGKVMEATFRVDNNSPVRVKDVEVTCRHFSKSDR